MSLLPLLAASALGAPVLADAPELSPLERCAAEAEQQAGIASGSWRDEVPLAVPRTDRLAIVVGVPCHRSEAIPSLAYSSRDAERVADTLQAGGFTVLRLQTVVDRATLAAALDRAGAAVTPGGTLLVYFSGHGMLRDEDGKLVRYLVMSDTDLTSIETTGLSVVDLDRRVSHVDAATRVIVHDTCFADRVGGKSPGVPRAGQAKGLSAPESNVALAPGDLRLSASKFFEQALESPAYQSSVYTHHLLGALSEPAADLDGDGCVGLIEAHGWAAAATTRERDGFQTPQMRVEQAPNLLLGCRPAHPATRAVLVAPPPNLPTTLTDRAGAVVARDGGTVAPGRYRLEVEKVVPDGLGDLATDRVVAMPVHLAPGEWLDVTTEVRLRRPLAGLELGIGWAPGVGEVYPSMVYGLSVWRLPRDRGPGRPLLGLRLAGAPGPGAPPVPEVRYSGGELLGQLGWQWTLGLSGPDAHVSLGPSLSAGGAYRRTLGAAGLSTVWPWIAEPAWRMHLSIDRFLGSIEAGARFVGGGDPGENQVVISGSPNFRVGVGVRL
jgi:uncharacterized caspase-like protein